MWQRTRKEAVEQRLATREAILCAVHGELESSAALRQTAPKELPAGGIPYPGFDVTGWPLVSQVAALTTLQRQPATPPGTVARGSSEQQKPITRLRGWGRALVGRPWILVRLCLTSQFSHEIVVPALDLVPSSHRV
jgi:hypothetical protein